jgi:hypothetical protein
MFGMAGLARRAGGASSSFTAQMTVGNGSYTDGWLYRWRGFISADSIYGGAGLIGGSMDNLDFGALDIVALFWNSDPDEFSTGTVLIEFVGDVSGLGTLVNASSVDGVPMYGDGGSAIYYPSNGTTVAQLGASSIPNPFGTSGTKTILLS